MQEARVAVIALLGTFVAGLVGCSSGQPIPGLEDLAEANGEYLRGDYDEALRLYREALRANPRHTVAHNNMALCHLAKGRLNEAYSEIQTAVSRNVQPQGGVLLNKATVLLAMRDPDGAVAALQEAKRSTTDHNLRAQIAYNLGWLRDEQGQTDRAIAEFEECLREAGVGGGDSGSSRRSDSRIWQKADVALGVQWAKKGDIGRARALFELVAKMNPVSPEAKTAALANLAALQVQ